MPSSKRISDSKLYNVPRYWYHVSTTLRAKEVILTPRDNDSGFNRADDEPDTLRICVSPSLEQCIIAVPYYYNTIFSVYRTKTKVKANRPINVFDSKITQEGWLIKPTTFIKMGTLDIDRMVYKIQNTDCNFLLKGECATSGLIFYTREAYRWWLKLKPWDFVSPVK